MPVKLICKTCHKEFLGETWMKQCPECYKNYRDTPRIQPAEGWKKGVFILTHPSVTKEELAKWMDENYPHDLNWAPVEVSSMLKVWWVCQNSD